MDTVGIFRPYGETGSEWWISNNIDGTNSTRYVFGIKSISPAQARNLVDTLLMIRSR